MIAREGGAQNLNGDFPRPRSEAKKHHPEAPMDQKSTGNAKKLVEDHIPSYLSALTLVFWLLIDYVGAIENEKEI